MTAIAVRDRTQTSAIGSGVSPANVNGSQPPDRDPFADLSRRSDSARF